MNKVAKIILILLACAFQAHGQYSYFTATIPFTPSDPTGAPSTSSGSRFRIDQPTRRMWVWNETSLTWVRIAQGIDKVLTCNAPSYIPAVGQSEFVVNQCLVPELYQHMGLGSWVCLNCASSGATNLSWSGPDTLVRLNSSSGSGVKLRPGTNQTFDISGDTLTISSTGAGGAAVNTDATLDGDGSIGTPLSISQQGALNGQILRSTGTTWQPSWGNPYVFVTSGATITTDINEILVGNAAANLIFGLPVCNAANDSKKFSFIFNGSDGFSKTIDPNGSQTFYDGTTQKIYFGNLSVFCTCRFSSGTGVWFSDSH